MTREIAELVEAVESGRVFCVEDGGIWFSGMNANVGRLARRVARRLSAEGYTVGDVREGPADEFSGLCLPVEEAEEIPDDVHKEIVSPPGGCSDESEEAPTP